MDLKILGMAALTSLAHILSYITVLFSEWRIEKYFSKTCAETFWILNELLPQMKKSPFTFITHLSKTCEILRLVLFAVRGESSNLAKSPAKTKENYQSKHKNLLRETHTCK